MVRKIGVTLIELLIVVIIVGILAALGSINYGPIRERALEREARANLRLIIAAERIYRMENTFYYPDSGAPRYVQDINDNLKLLLPTAGTPYWTYSIPGNFNGTAQATGGGKTCTMAVHDAEPVCTP